MKRQIMGIALFLFITGVAGQSIGANYSFTSLGSLGGNQSSPFDINNTGQIVGSSYDSSNGEYGFIYQNGTMSKIIPTDGIWSNLSSINDSGEAVGTSGILPAGNAHGFVYSGATFTDLGSLGGDRTYARGINSSGKIAGYSYNSSNNVRGYIYDNGTMTDLEDIMSSNRTYAFSINDSDMITGYTRVPEGTISAFVYQNGTMTYFDAFTERSTTGVKINNAGQVVGYGYDLSNNVHAFIYLDGVITDLGTLGGRYSYGYDINDRGQAVGMSQTSSEQTHAFIYEDDTMFDLNDLVTLPSGWILKDAMGINEYGDIIGNAISPEGNNIAYLLYNHEAHGDNPPDNGSSVPEPLTVLLFLPAVYSLRNRFMGYRK